MTDFLLAIVVGTIPVLGIVVLAMAGRLLRKCGSGPRGDCLPCGRSGCEPKATDDATACRTGSKAGSCPADRATHG